MSWGHFLERDNYDLETVKILRFLVDRHGTAEPDGGFVCLVIRFPLQALARLGHGEFSAGCDPLILDQASVPVNPLRLKTARNGIESDAVSRRFTRALSRVIFPSMGTFILGS